MAKQRSGMKFPSESMYTASPSTPLCSFGNLASMQSCMASCVFPTPDKPTIYVSSDKFIPSSNSVSMERQKVTMFRWNEDFLDCVKSDAAVTEVVLGGGGACSTTATRVVSSTVVEEAGLVELSKWLLPLG